MKKIFYSLSIILLLALNTNAMQNNIKNEMSIKIHSALNILKSKKENNRIKAKKIFKIFDEMFDYNLMARLSLGRGYWTSINTNEKNEFVKSFISLLKESFIEKLKLYNNQKMIIKDFLKSRKDRAKLITKLVGKKNSMDIIYKFYYSKQRGWIIYDVVVAGVSIIQSYREQFNDLLNNMNFTQFLNKIKTTKTNKNNA